MVAVGFGLALWYGWDWYQLPRWSEQEIEQSVELNLRLDLQRAGAAHPGAAQLALMRQQIRTEIEAEISGERAKPRNYALAGLVFGIAGAASMLIARRRP